MKALGIATMGLALALCGCGGGSSSNSSPPPPPPPPPSFSITTSSLPATVIGQPYTATLAASGGTGTLTWTAGTPFAAGLNLSSAGVISGATQAAGVMNVPVTVVDSSTPPQTASKTLSVDSFGFTYKLNFNPGWTNERFTQGMYVLGGGVVPINWSISAGSLPPGLQIFVYPDTRTMTFLGIPTQPGTYNFTVRAVDSGTPARAAEQSSQIIITPGPIKITTKSLPHATSGQEYSFQLQLTGGWPPYTWSLDSFSDKLPAGFSLDAATGTIHGVPAAGGYAQMALHVTDGRWGDSKSFPFYIAPSALPPRNDTLATATPIYAPTVADRMNIYKGSISPYGDPAAGTGPDTDYYKLTLAAGSTWIVIVQAKTAKDEAYGGGTYALDPVLEILDANGRRLTTCNDPFDDNPPAGVPVAKDTTPQGFDDPCMNNGTAADKATAAWLDFKVPGSTGDVTVLLHVFDWRGYARPDMYYDLSIGMKQ